MADMDVRKKERVVRETISVSKSSSDAATSRAGGSIIVKDDYDDDFEAYEDDFDDVESSPAPPVKSAAKALPKSAALSNDEISQLRHSMDLENSEATNRRHLQAKSENVHSLIPNKSKRETEFDHDMKDTSGDAPVAVKSSLAPRRVKKFSGGASIDLGSASMDPRARRIERLLASGVLEMHEDKFTLLNIAPTTPHDLYLRLLRSQTATIRQIGVPNDEDKRDVEVNTDDIVMVDKEMQFCNGDDTVLLNAMEDIRNKRLAENFVTSGSQRRVALGGMSTGTMTDSSGYGRIVSATAYSSTATTSRLASFVQRAGRVCEILLDDASRRKRDKDDDESASRGRKTVSMFDSQDAWVKFGDDLSSGATELIRMRSVSSAKFNTLRPHQLLTAHPPPLENDSDDLRPDKSLFCIWDMSTPAAPSFVLECSGQVSSCCFSSSQWFVVLAGTQEGTLALWDLREENAIHRDKDSVDLRIERGIRKACYSTALSYSAMLPHSNSDYLNSEELHVSQITQIEPLDYADDSSASAGTASSSQFASIDAGGLVVLWVTSDSSFEGGNLDPGLSPWGRLGLVRTRSLRVHMPGLFSPSLTRGKDQGSDVSSTADIYPSLHSPPVLGAIAGDFSTLLVAAPKGKVSKLTRYGVDVKSINQAVGAFERLASAIEALDSGSNKLSVVNDPAKKPSVSLKELGLEFYSTVTCISVQNATFATEQRESSRGRNKSPTAGPTMHSLGEAKDGSRFDEETKASRVTFEDKAGFDEPSTTQSAAQFILVGRSDGAVDLFEMNIRAPLQSWALSDFAELRGGDGGGTSSGAFKPGKVAYPVVMVKWFPKRVAAFVAADASGAMFFFDLLKNAFAPIYADRLPSIAGDDDTHTSIASQSTDISHIRSPGYKTAYAVAYLHSNSSLGIAGLFARKFSHLATSFTVETYEIAAGSGRGLKNYDDAKSEQTVAAPNEYQAFLASLSSWAARTASKQIVAVTKTTSTEAKS